MNTYKIVRYYAGDRGKRVVKRGLTLEQAKDHCKESETSSRTASSTAARRRTKRWGSWFDGYEKENVC